MKHIPEPLILLVEHAVYIYRSILDHGIIMLCVLYFMKNVQMGEAYYFALRITRIALLIFMHAYILTKFNGHIVNISVYLLKVFSSTAADTQRPS